MSEDSGRLVVVRQRWIIEIKMGAWSEIDRSRKEKYQTERQARTALNLLLQCNQLKKGRPYRVLRVPVE